MRDADGPIAGAVLSAVARGDNDCDDGPLFALFATTTDEAGRYSLPIVTLTGSGGGRGSIITVACVKLDVTVQTREHSERLDSVDVIALTIYNIAQDIDLGR